MTLLQPSKGKQKDRLPLIEALKAVPEQVARELAGLSETQLRYRPNAGAWSLKEVCGHLRDFAEIDHRRLYMMMTQENPLLPGYDQEDLAREHSHQESDISTIVAELRSWRLKTVELLTELVDANWARQGRHEEFGRMSIRQFVERWVRHDAMHLEHIRSLKEEAPEA